MKHAPIGDRMVALFLFGVLGFSPPLLTIFAAPWLAGGIPVLYDYLFAFWAILIVLLAFSISKPRRDEPGPDQPPES
jgi:hypothetical protein